MYSLAGSISLQIWDFLKDDLSEKLHVGDKFLSVLNRINHGEWEKPDIPADIAQVLYDCNDTYIIMMDIIVNLTRERCKEKGEKN